MSDREAKRKFVETDHIHVDRHGNCTVDERKLLRSEKVRRDLDEAERLRKEGKI